MPVSKSKIGKPLGGIGAERQSDRAHSLVLDDRLLSKQYITGRIEAKISNDAFDASWDEDEITAPSKNAVFDKISSMGLYTHEWTHESEATTSKVKTAHSGNYGIGSTLNFTNDITEKLVVDGNIKAIGDLFIGDDASLISDGALLNFGVDSDVSLTHVADTGLLLNSTRQLQFNDASQYIAASSTADLDIAATTDINLNCTTVDINANADISGTLTTHGNTTINGNLTVTGTATSISTSQVSMEDPFLLLNAESTGGNVDSGIEIYRGEVLNSRKIFWDEGEDIWKIQTADDTYSQIQTGSGSGTITALNNRLANRLVTIGSTTTELDGEINLTFDGTNLALGANTAGNCTLTGTAGDSGTTALNVVGGTSASSNAAVSIVGHLEATTKSFNIPHPLYVNKRLVYGSLEGPEHGMYQRGSFDIEDGRRLVAVDLPIYWYKMVYDDYSINLTTYGDYNVWISNRDENGFWVETNAEKEWSFDWSVIGGRKDAKMVVEPDA